MASLIWGSRGDSVIRPPMMSWDPDTDRLVKEGYLNKKGGGQTRSNWTTRWFVVSKTHIQYYKSRKDLKPKGTISLLDVSEVTPADELEHGQEFQVITPERVFRICAKTEKERDDWIRAIIQTKALLLPPVPEFTHSSAPLSFGSTQPTTSSSQPPTPPTSGRWVPERSSRPTLTTCLSGSRLSEFAGQPLLGASRDSKMDSHSGPSSPSRSSDKESFSPQLDSLPNDDLLSSGFNSSGMDTDSGLDSESGTPRNLNTNVGSLSDTATVQEEDEEVLKKRILDELEFTSLPNVSFLRVASLLLSKHMRLKDQLEHREEASIRAFNRTKELTEENSRLRTELDLLRQQHRQLKEDHDVKLATVEKIVTNLKTQLKEIDEASLFVHELMAERKRMLELPKATSPVMSPVLSPVTSPVTSPRAERPSASVDSINLHLPMGLPKSLLALAKLPPSSAPPLPRQIDLPRSSTPPVTTTVRVDKSGSSAGTPVVSPGSSPPTSPRSGKALVASFKQVAVSQKVQPEKDDDPPASPSPAPAPTPTPAPPSPAPPVVDSPRCLILSAQRRMGSYRKANEGADYTSPSEDSPAPAQDQRPPESSFALVSNPSSPRVGPDSNSDATPPPALEPTSPSPSPSPAPLQDSTATVGIKSSEAPIGSTSSSVAGLNNAHRLRSTTSLTNIEPTTTTAKPASSPRSNFSLLGGASFEEKLASFKSIIKPKSESSHFGTLPRHRRSPSASPLTTSSSSSSASEGKEGAATSSKLAVARQSQQSRSGPLSPSAIAKRTSADLMTTT